MRDRVISAITPRVASGNAPRHQVGARAGAMALYRLNGITRAGRFEPTLTPEPGAQQQPIAFEQRDEQSADHGRGVHRCGRMARCSTVSSSALSAKRSCEDAALKNCFGSKGVRSRTTHIPGAIEEARLATLARISRLTKCRVTDRRA